jgi:hypothetical protein
MAVKYGSLGEHISDLMTFLDCERPFVVRSRTSCFDDQPPEIKAGLAKTYGEVKALVDTLPSLIRINA